MWNALSSIILKYRILFTVIICVITAIMAKHAVNVEYSVERAKILPPTHQVFLENQKFQKTYGNHHVMAIAITDSNFFTILVYDYTVIPTSDFLYVDSLNSVFLAYRFRPGLLISILPLVGPLFFLPICLRC